MMPHPIDILPPPNELREAARVLAALDAILSPEWQYRYYSFDPAWSDTEWMASMRDGCGSHWYLVRVHDVGFGLLGLSLRSPGFRQGDPFPGILDQVPASLHAGFVNEPAFDSKNATFTAWWLDADPGWNAGLSGKEDGARELLRELLGGPEAYVAFASDYYETSIPQQLVAALFGQSTIDQACAERLNPEVDWKTLRPELEAMGIPIR